MTHTFDDSFNSDNSNWDNSQPDSSQTDFSQADLGHLGHDLNPDFSHHSPTHATTDLGESHFSHDSSGFSLPPQPPNFGGRNLDGSPHSWGLGGETDFNSSFSEMFASDISSLDRHSSSHNFDSFNSHEANQPFADSDQQAFSIADSNNISSLDQTIAHSAHSDHSIEAESSIHSTAIEPMDGSTQHSITSSELHSSPTSSPTMGMMAAPCSDPLTTDSRNSVEVSTTGNVFLAWFWYGSSRNSEKS